MSDNVTADANTNDTDTPVRQVERRMIRTSKAPEIPPFESRNWLIHSHYMSRDFDTCRGLIIQQLAETQGMCEYAQYVQGMVLRQEGRIQESLEALQVASRLNPQNPENLKQIARSLFLMGKHKTAIEVCSNIFIYSFLFFVPVQPTLYTAHQKYSYPIKYTVNFSASFC